MSDSRRFTQMTIARRAGRLIIPQLCTRRMLARIQDRDRRVA
jgi:hypothetical protein